MSIQIGEKDRLISDIPITTTQINGVLQVDKSDHPLTIGNNKVSVTKSKLREVDRGLPIETRIETTRPKAITITNREDRMIIIIVAIAIIHNPIERVNLKESTIIVTEINQVIRND